MKKKFLKIQKLGIIILVFQLFLSNFSGQLKDYQLTEKGDTLNGVDNNTITEYKIVKATQYSVKHGEWKFFEPGTGRVIKTENYDRGALVKDPVTNDVATDAPKKKVKPKEVLEFEKKNSGKKKVKLREGQTGY